MPTYKEKQILDKVCKVTRQKQIKYYDFIPFFDFQYEKIIFNCQPSHISPCSAVPVREHLTAEWDVAASSPRTGLIFRALKKVRNEGTAFVQQIAKPS